MAWKKVSTSSQVTIDLEEFSDMQLFQALIDRGTLTEEDAEEIMNYLCIPVGMETSEISTAWEYAARGERNEALVHIERALGNEWIGRLTE